MIRDPMTNARFHSCLRRSAVTAALIGLAGCTSVPELDATVPDEMRNAPYPELVELDASLTTPATPRKDGQRISKSLSDWQKRLQDRARRLNATIIDADTRARMQAGVTQ
jgi:hypothetical protein